MNEQIIHLDINKQPDASQTVRIGQGDKGGTTILAKLYDNGTALDLTGKNVRFMMRQPGGRNQYVRDINCEISGNTVTYEVDESHVASAVGYTDIAYFDVLEGTSVVTSTQRFRIEILRSAHDGATPAQSWDTEIDELIQRGEQAVSDAEQAVDDATSAVDAANQAIARIEPTIEQAAEDAAEQATADAEQRIQDAIDAVGDISELAVPLMSHDVRGGAKLEQHGGLALRDGALGIGSLVQESDGYARGGLAEVTAKGHAEQFSTTGKNLLELPDVASSTVNGKTLSISNGVVTVSGTVSSVNKVDFIVPVSMQLTSGNTYHIAIYGMSDTANSTIYLQNSSNTFVANGNMNATGFSYTPTSDQTINALLLRFWRNNTMDGTFTIQLELGSTATPYEPYSGGAPSPSPDYPQEIQVVRGRNLFDSAINYTLGGSNSSMRLTSGGTTYYARIAKNTDYYIQSYSYGGVRFRVVLFESEPSTTAQTALGLTETDEVTAPTGMAFNSGKYEWVALTLHNTTYVPTMKAQLTLGSTPQPYVPYGYVGMEARDPDTDELISCTALPLPQRGWVAGPPDGTADLLRLDGAGKCEWELGVKEVTYDGSGDESWTKYGDYSDADIAGFYISASDIKSNTNDADGYCSIYPVAKGTATIDTCRLSKQYNRVYLYGIQRFIQSASASDFATWLSINPVTVLYPLATPVTEDCGYCEDWPTDIPEGAVITIPELDEIGIRYFVDSTVTELARQWYARANSEYADRLSALEQAVAELATS